MDRAAATANTLLVMTNTMFLEWDSILIYVFMLISGLALFYRSRGARVDGTLGEFAAWHTVWHFWFPFGLMLWLSYTKYDDHNQHEPVAQASIPPTWSYVTLLSLTHTVRQAVILVIGSCIALPVLFVALCLTRPPNTANTAADDGDARSFASCTVQGESRDPDGAKEV